MKLSEAQRERLAWVVAVDDPPRSMSKRGSFYANQRTHDALLRKGLIRVDRAGYTHATDLGRAALQSTDKKACAP